ncbi:MAG: hypothetical protein ACLPKE_36360 [Streptosporangiaceae bacterium]
MPDESYKNIARGHAQVGMQVGKHVGDVHVHKPAPDDLADQIEAVQSELRALRKSRDLDEQTYLTAQGDLEEAAGLVLPADDEPMGDDKRSQLIRVLQRVWLVLSGVADLGSKVAAIITAAQIVR